VRAITEGNKLIETVKKLEIIREKKEMSNINIDNIMKQVIEHYAEEARKRDIEISYEPSGAIVMGNELVEDIFSNLLKNSIEHSYGQHIKIYAKDDDEGWSIFMEDDGVGIPEEEKNKIFQQGWKGQGSTGSGLGLYLVKKIVDGFGGKIWVESGEDEYPEGCRFVVWLKKGGIATKKNRSEIIGNESRVARVRW
jgi:signal transduction histidine kinase